MVACCCGNLERQDCGCGGHCVGDHPRCLWPYYEETLFLASIFLALFPHSAFTRRLIKEEGCVDLSMDTLHLKYPLVPFGSEDSALTLPLFCLSPNIILLCHCFSTVTKDQLLMIFDGTKLPLCVNVPLKTHSFIHSWLLSMST